ncbi:MAG: hypothetical protein ACTSX1_03710 [Candidatus Heimdallarchaeaceae archaeon]
MKVKTDFVTNSSSTAYIIQNTSDTDKDLVDFVKENPQIISEFLSEYDWHADDPKYSQHDLIKSAEKNNLTFQAESSVRCVFGDEQETLIGQVFDYALRGGGKSENFIWSFFEWMR